MQSIESLITQTYLEVKFMESHAFDHNLHHNEAGNSLYSDIANAQDLHSHNLDINGDHFNNDLNDSNYDINQNQYDYYQNHGLNNDHYHNHSFDYSNNQILNQVDHNQFISDYQQPSFSNTISEISAGNHPQSFSHDQYLVHDTQRLGSEKASELLNKANELEKKANESKIHAQDHSKEADWHRDHNNPSQAASLNKDAQNDMANFEKYQAEAQKLREQAKKV